MSEGDALLWRTRIGKSFADIFFLIYHINIPHTIYEKNCILALKITPVMTVFRIFFASPTEPTNNTSMSHHKSWDLLCLNVILNLAITVTVSHSVWHLYGAIGIKLQLLNCPRWTFSKWNGIFPRCFDKILIYWTYLKCWRDSHKNFKGTNERKKKTCK